MMDDQIFNTLAVDIEYYNHRICTPTWLILDDVTKFVDVTYVIRGSAIYTVNQKQFKASAGDLICIQKGCRRSAVACPEDLMECYAVNGQVFSLLGGEVPMPFPLVSKIGVHKDIICQYQNLNTVWLLREALYVLQARAIYMLILRQFAQILYVQGNESRSDKRVRKTLQYIANHYAEQLTVREMAEMLGLNVAYFGNLFKKEMGVSFHQYFTSVRLNHAEDLLRSGEFNVNEVASACGFLDTFYFSKVFKEKRGVAPSEILYLDKIEKRAGKAD